jgi:hypothetical protein
MTRTLRRLSFLIVAAAVGVAACRGTHPAPQFAWDKTADFATPKTYAFWVGPGYPPPHGDSIIDGEFISQHVRAAIEASLAGKGYQKVDPSKAALLVGFLSGDTGVSDEVKDPNYAWLTGYESVMYEKSRAITIDFRTADKKLIWRGSITRLEGENPDAAGREIHSEISTLLSKFPPPPGAVPTS